MLKDVLPHGCLPRCLSRAQAAAYVGVGTSLFDEMVKDGRMPKPRRINGRKVWDRQELDEAISVLPHDGDGDNDARGWPEPKV